MRSREDERVDRMHDLSRRLRKVVKERPPENCPLRWLSDV
jgi:hypothetical protein